MFLRRFVAGLLLAPTLAYAQAVGAPRPQFDAFEAATVRPVDPDHPERGRYYRMQGTNRFVAVNYTLRLLIAAAYDLNPKTISGGPAWVDGEAFNVTARTPGELQPNRREQMTMLRVLLSEEFGLRFHREGKTFSLYELQLSNGGPKLKTATEAPDEAPQVISTVYPDRIEMPARNVTMDDLAATMQRALVDRPVVNKTGLTGRYDFDLRWAPDATQLEGDGHEAAADAPDPPLFAALQQQLGLRLEATRGEVSALVIDGAHKPL